MLLATSGNTTVLNGTVGSHLSQPSHVNVASAFAPPTALRWLIEDDANQSGTLPFNNGCNNWGMECSPVSQLFGGPSLAAILGGSNDPGMLPWMRRVLWASPVTWVDGDDPPMFFVHGTLDRVVPTNQGSRMSAALYAAGVPHDFRALPNVTHNTVPAAVNPAIVKFYTDHFAGNELVSTGATFCLGDGSEEQCPCAPLGPSWLGARQGCKNVQLTPDDPRSIPFDNVVGANLSAFGGASISGPALVMRAAGMPHGSTATLFKGSVAVAPAVFGHGVSCLSPLRPVAIATKKSVWGVAEFTEVNNPAYLPIPSIPTHYQVQYTDVSGVCTTGNTTNGVEVTWAP